MNENSDQSVSNKKWAFIVVLIWLAVATHSFLNPLLGTAVLLMNPFTIKYLIVTAPILFLIIPARNYEKRYSEKEWAKWIIIALCASIILSAALLTASFAGTLFYLFDPARFDPIRGAFLLPTLVSLILLVLLYFGTRSKSGKVILDMLFWLLVIMFGVQGAFLITLLGLS